MIADSLEELEDALKRFDEDMDEDVFDSSTHQTRTKQVIYNKYNLTLFWFLNKMCMVN